MGILSSSKASPGQLLGFPVLLLHDLLLALKHTGDNFYQRWQA